MRATRLLGCTALLVLLCAGAALAQGQNNNYLQQYEKGSIDWQNGLVSAVGIGAPPSNAANMAQARAMAVRAATVVARRNLLELIQGVQIDSTTTVRNYMLSDDTVVTRVTGFLQNSQILDTAYMSDGSVEVTVGISLRGGFADVIIPKNMPFDQNAPSPAPVQPAPQTPDTGGGAYTGLLVDASGLGARPAMSPKVLDETGQEVYGSSFVSREYAIQQGMAGYAKSVDQARNNPRVANNPMVVQAVSATGKAKTNLVVSNEDANRIRQMADTQNFLEKCRVMIVLD